ncbi:hypothetical protein J6590_059002 [Homalodisca vitripennis]|nr:hypothetical protein J6590_059002 [Homalodisca vitripennis]
MVKTTFQSVATLCPLCYSLQEHVSTGLIHRLRVGCRVRYCRRIDGSCSNVNLGLTASSAATCGFTRALHSYRDETLVYNSHLLRDR